MCGIAGIVERERPVADESLIRRMTDILRHRGPDGEGTLVDGTVALGHRRLAIIDLTTGAQPMASEDGEVWITFNGEIYNFRELREELAARGRRFRSTSDTEVILAAYQTWGPECVTRLRGMFAFGIWDRARRRLVLARDRVGIKPLVYAWDQHRLLFASEVKAILEDPGVRREVDWGAVRDYLTLQYVPSPRTIFAGIRKLPPASYLVWEPERGEPEIRRYWNLRLEPDRGRSDSDWVDGLRWHLDDAVKSHLVSDVPIGAFLSGGIDSSTVVATMARTGGPVRTFSIGFDEGTFDELRYARLLARRYQTDHYELVLKPDAMGVWPQLVWEFDEPFADSSALPTYYVCKITREHVTVALSGDGGDESFAGYSRYARAQALQESLDVLPGRWLRSLYRLAARLLPPGARGQAYFDLRSQDPIGRYFQMVTLQRTGTLRRLLTPDAQSQVGWEVDPKPFYRLAIESGAPDYLSTLQYIDVHTYLPDDILTKVDRASMLVSLESRVPLLDHRLMEYVATMPAGLKLRGGIGKAILKRAMADRLPMEILERPKMGFGVPFATWFRRDMAEYTRGMLLDRRTAERGLFEPGAVARMLDDHQAGRRDHSSRIWSLLCFEAWARQWLDRR